MVRSPFNTKAKSDLPLSDQVKKFSYTGVDTDKNKVSGVVESSTRGKVKYQLEENGITNLSITVKKSLLQMEFGKSVSGEVLLQTTRQLSSFAQAGIPAARGLAILALVFQQQMIMLSLNSVQCGEHRASLILVQTVTAIPKHPH